MGNEFKYYFRRVTLFYYGFRYSEYFAVVFPVILISLGVLISIFFVVPSVSSWFSIQSEVQFTQTKINVMRQNIYVLQTMNKFDIDNNLILAAKALPADKDFVQILNGINKSAATSGVALDDFYFSLGKIEMKDNVKTGNQKVIPIEINMRADGDINSVSEFIVALEQELPIIEIKNISFAKDKAELSMQFVIKSFPAVALAKDEYIKGLSADEISLLNKLRLRAGQ